MATLYNQYIYKNGAWMKIGTSSDSVTYALSYSALTGLLTLTGSDGSTSTVTIESGSSDAITGITVNGTTVTVTDGVAAISIPTNVSAFTNDAGYLTTHQDISGKVDTQHTFSEGTGTIQYNSEGQAILLYRSDEVGSSSVELYPSDVGLYWGSNDYSNYNSSLSLGSSGITISSTAISGVQIHNVTTPTNATDAVNKQYVDNLIPTVPTNVSAFTNDAGYITTPAFKITVTENNGTYTADKTYAEISQAINNGYICYVTDGIYNYYYTFAIEGYFYFQHSSSQTDNYFFISSNSVLYNSENQFGTAAQNMVFATPPNQNGAPYFRALVANDIPDLSSVYSTTDEKVKQINTTSGTYSILLGNTYSAGTVTSSVNKAQLLSYNVSSNRLNVNNIQVGSVSQSGTIMLGGVALIGTGSSSGLVDNTVTLPAATGTVALTSNTPAQASISSTGLITYKNSGGTSLFTLQLPLYNGGVS